MRQIALLLGCVFALGLFSCKTTVEEVPTNDEDVYIIINGSETMTSLEVGQEYNLRLSNSSSATWSVNNSAAVTLSASSGVSVNLSAQAAGGVTVMATVDDKTYTCALQIIKKSSEPSGGNQNVGETNAPNVSFINLSAYKVVVCRDGLSAEIATVEAGGKKSMYVSPGANEIIFHFRYSYCIIDDDDCGTIWMDVADNGAYTYPVDSADIAHGVVKINIPAPKNPQFNAAYLKIENQSMQPVSLYNGNTQQKLYNQEKYYIQPGHSGVYNIPPDVPFEGFTLGTSPSSANAITSFDVVSGVLYTCEFAELGFSIDVTEEIRLGEMWADETYTVTFEANGGTVSYPIETTLLEESDVPNPTRQGYSFVGWYIDSELQHTIVYPYTVTADIMLYAKWLENTDTTYTVRHFKQNIDCTSYTLTETETLTGTMGAVSAAVAMTYIGFTADSFEQVPVSADGATAIDIYYDRNEYAVTFYANDGTDDTQTQTFYYGITQQLKSIMFSNPGYAFLGWATSKTDTPAYNNTADFLIDEQNPTDITLYAVWRPGIIVTADTIGSIDLSDITDDFTIKVVGNISQSTLQTLADKIKNTNASINLDLSEATGLMAISSIVGSTSSDSKSIFTDCLLNSIALPETLEVIGSYAFAECSIKSVTIPASVQTIESRAFYHCSNLESVEIDGTETVEDCAFRWCENLSSVTMKSIGAIGSDAFAGCINLSSVTMESIGTIGSDAFAGCTNLSSVTMRSIGTIGKCVFLDCKSLSFIKIDAEAIGSKAFYGCYYLTDVVIGKNVKLIDNLEALSGCFARCSNLTTVRFEDTEGWYCVYGFNRIYIDVTDVRNNANNLKSADSTWHKE